MHPLAIAFFILGILLLLAEIFIPGFGLFAVFGTISIAIGIFLVEDSLYMALLEIAIVLVSIVIIVPLLIRFMAGKRGFKRLSLGTALRTEDGFISRAKGLDALLGAEGSALTDLHPSGTMILSDNRRMDVTTQGDYIEKGMPIEVIGVQGTWLVVRRLEKENAYE